MTFCYFLWLESRKWLPGKVHLCLVSEHLEAVQSQLTKCFVLVACFACCSLGDSSWQLCLAKPCKECKTQSQLPFLCVLFNMDAFILTEMRGHFIIIQQMFCKFVTHTPRFSIFADMLFSFSTKSFKKKISSLVHRFLRYGCLVSVTTRWCEVVKKTNCCFFWSPVLEM